VSILAEMITVRRGRAKRATPAPETAPRVEVTT
jgi:hypothetical protein